MSSEVGEDSDLRATLADPRKLEAFRRFLESEFSDENLAFFVEVEKFEKVMDREESKNLARRIYRKFIDRCLLSSISVSHGREFLDFFPSQLKHSGAVALCPEFCSSLLISCYFCVFIMM